MKAAAVIGEEIARLAAELTVGEHRLVRKIGEFDASGEWARQGALTCAKWLSWRIGLAPGAAREKVRVARALPALPHLDRAFERGELSYSKVRAVTRVATPESDEDLVQIAKHTTASQLECVCRRFHRVLEHDARMTPADAEAKRVVESRWTDDGQLSVKIMLPADEGARLLAALESAHATAKEDSASATRADGLRELVESWFQSGARPRPGGAPHEVVVHVLAETLAEEKGKRVPAETRAGQAACAEPEKGAVGQALAESGDRAASGDLETTDVGLLTDRRTDEARSVDAEESASSHVPAETRASERGAQFEHTACSHVPAETRAGRNLGAYIENAEGPGVSAETARRLACDASKVELMEDAQGRALDVGRKSRTVPAAMRRALDARDNRTCKFPGCTHAHFLDAHHVHHWANGGPTAIDNLVLLCRRHHTFVHEHGYSLERDAAGAFVFRAPNGKVLPASPRPPHVADALDALVNHRRDAGIDVDELSLLPDWRGDVMDYAQVLDFLCHRYRQPQSAGQ